MSENQPIVVGHFDGHGVITAFLAARKLGAVEAFADFPATGPENLINTLQNRYAAAPRRLRIVIVDVPINIKDPISFVEGLERLAEIHDVEYYDHHESSVQFLQRFRKVKAQFIGPSAYDLSRIFDGNEWAIIAAICDRDPAVVQRGLWTQRLQQIADGIDVLVRRGANQLLQRLLQDPESVKVHAIGVADQIPTVALRRQVGVVGVAERLPEGWSLKALEKMVFQHNLWYGVGYEYVSRLNQWVVRAIIRWDVRARNPQLPSPRAIGEKLYPTRNIIGHPDAISVAATNEDEAVRMAEELAREIADGVTGYSPATLRFIGEGAVGQAFLEILTRLTQIQQQQAEMYREYLELKRKQVELLEQLERARAD